jgi:hypothetical protein
MSLAPSLCALCSLWFNPSPKSGPLACCNPAGVDLLFPPGTPGATPGANRWHPSGMKALPPVVIRHSSFCPPCEHCPIQRSPGSPRMLTRSSPSTRRGNGDRGRDIPERAHAKTQRGEGFPECLPFFAPWRLERSGRETPLGFRPAQNGDSREAAKSAKQGSLTAP